MSTSISCIRHETSSEIQALADSTALFEFDQKLSPRVQKRSFQVLPRKAYDGCRSVGVKSGTLKFILQRKDQPREQAAAASGGQGYCIWEVNISVGPKIGKCFICKGWKPFMEVNGLGRGDVLRFRMHCPHIWSVRILQCQSFPRIAASSSLRAGEPSPRTIRAASSLLPPAQPPPRTRDLLHSTPKQEQAEEELSCPLDFEHQNFAIFKVEIEPKHLREPYHLDVPQGFTCRMPKKSCPVNIKSHGPNTWKADWIYSRTGKCVVDARSSFLSTGRLGVGDLLVMMLVNAAVPTIRVYRYRKDYGLPCEL